MSAAYTPPAVAQDGFELALEPPRFCRTGAGLIDYAVLRDEFYLEALAYSLDAPPNVPSGSVDGALHRLTDWNPDSRVPPWHWLGTSVSRERA